MYKVEKTIADSVDITLPNIENFEVDFNEPQYPQTAQDQIAIEKWELENNIINQADLLVKRNKELDIEESKKIIQENKGINDANQSRGVFDRLRAQTARIE